MRVRLRPVALDSRLRLGLVDFIAVFVSRKLPVNKLIKFVEFNKFRKFSKQPINRLC